MVAIESNKKLKKQESSSSSSGSSDSEDSDMEINVKNSSNIKKPVVKNGSIASKPVSKPTKVESESEENEEEEAEEEEVEMKIHKKNGSTHHNSSFHSNFFEKHQDSLDDIAITDVKSKEAVERGQFKNFNLSKQITEKLVEKKITYLYPIQIATLKHIRENHDVIAQARTGTGKTMAFAIPIVERLQSKKPANEICKNPRALIMEPTRELAKQVGDDFQAISTTLRTCCVYGGMPYEKQLSDMRKGVDVMAGTPGRIMDFIQTNQLDLSQVEHVVLDEVDRMLDMGFQDSVEEILKHVYTEGKARKAQTLFFSATCPSWVKRIAQKYMNEDFKFIDLIGDSKLKTATTVEHLAIQCSYHDRASTIGSVLQVYSGKHGRAMIFCQTKKDADELACSSEIKQESHVLHGDVPQDKRELVLQKFRDGKYKVLITTDVAARGLDIPEVDLVICCSPPKDYESYVHRSGRTGRAGRTGTSICFYKPQETNGLLALERNTGTKFKRVGAPSSADIVEASTTDAVRSLDTVADELIEKFRSGAEEILKNREAVSALAAALAVISGCTKVTQRSLLTSKENMTTYLLCKTDEEIRGKSFVYVIMKKMIGDDKAEAAIQRICFTKDRKGLVFDVASEYDDLIQEKWYNTKALELKALKELPELEEEKGGFSGGGGRSVGDRRGGFGNGGGGGRFGNRQGGGRGDFRGGRGGRGGGFGANRNGSGGDDSNKRKFDRVAASNTPTNKRIKFD